MANGLNWIDHSIDGWMSHDELQYLYNLATKYDTIVEIGSWMGKSTYALCSGGLSRENSMIYAVDHFLGSSEHQDTIKKGTNPYEKFVENMKEFTRNLTVVKMSSQEANSSPLIPDMADVVFIDGAHEYEHITSDLSIWARRTRHILCGHDYSYESIKKALDAYFGSRKDITNPVGSIWELDVNQVNFTLN